MRKDNPRYLVERFIATAFALLLLACFARGQTPGTGAIAGSVYDPAHRALAGAALQAENEATHVTRLAATNRDGEFRFPLLEPGAWIVTVNAPGFAAAKSQSVAVTVSETRSLDIVLSIASASTTVKVSTHAQPVDIESSTRGGVVDQQAIQSLPLSSRNYTQILSLSPGVVVDLPNAAQLGSGTQNVASDGATPTANNIQFNGVDANNLAENSAATATGFEVGTAIPSPDTIEEFRVQTANFDAAYGRGSGANVDLVSRTGTDHFHGSAWEFIRNNIFNANDFFSKLDGQPRPDLKQNQFGAAIGGPIWHGRTVFFGAYEGLREVNGLGDEQNPVLPLLPQNRTAAALGAQFCPAGHLNGSGQPASGYLTIAGGTQVACDGSNINPVALAILNAKLPNGQYAIPSPQVVLPATGDDPSDQMPVGQSTFAIPAHYSANQFSVNLDHALRSTNTLAGRFFYARGITAEPFSPNAANVPGWGTNALNRNTMFVLSDTHVFSPTLVNIARLGLMRFDGVARVENPLLAQTIGEGTPTGTPGTASHAPGLSVGGFTIGDAGTPAQWQVTNTFVAQDTLAITRGRHNFRAGAEIKRHQVDIDTPQEIDGLLIVGTFDDFLLGESAAQNNSPFGLSNVTLSISGGGIFRRDERYTDLAGFLQDDFRLTPRLTLNEGLRYEISGAPTETHGRLANFNPLIATQGAVDATGTFSGFTMPSNFKGTLPDGVLRTSFPGLYQTPRGDIAPRLGFAWQMSQRPLVVLRGGYGIYFDRHSGTLAGQTVNQPPFATLQFIGGAPNGTASLQSPFVPLIQPQSSYPVFTPRTLDATPFIEGTNPHMLDGRTQEYNLSVDYALGRNYVLSVGYVGTHSDHRSGQVEFDQALLASPSNPINGETTNSVANVSARMPIQGIGQGSLFTDSVFIGNYNSLQTSLRRQMQYGFEVEASYTWSKNLDEVNGEGGVDVFELQLPTNDQHHVRQSSYGPAGDDRAQRLVANFHWQSPALHLNSVLARRALSGWQFSGIGVVQSGNALSVFDSNAGSVYGLIPGEVRAQRAPGSPNPLMRGSMFSRAVNGYVDPTAFTRAPEAPNGTSLADQDFGSSGVGILRGPGQHSVDAAVERSFPIAEVSNVRFRAEFFNATNTPQFGNPNTSLGFSDPTLPNPSPSPTFGKITSTNANPRIVQFALRYQF